MTLEEVQEQIWGDFKRQVQKAKKGERLDMKKEMYRYVKTAYNAHKEKELKIVV